MRYEVFHGNQESYIFAVEDGWKVLWWAGYRDWRNCAADVMGIIRGGDPTRGNWGHGTLVTKDAYREYLQVSHRYRDHRYIIEEVCDEVWSAVFG